MGSTFASWRVFDEGTEVGVDEETGAVDGLAEAAGVPCCTHPERNTKHRQSSAERWIDLKKISEAIIRFLPAGFYAS